MPLSRRGISPESEHRGVVSRSLVKARHEMRAAWTCRAGAHGEAAGELGLARGSQRRTLLVPHADPLDPAPPDRIAERVQGVADQSEDLRHANLFEDVDKHFSNGT
nr:hypothetical protein [Mesorhizobium camelthorni]